MIGILAKPKCQLCLRQITVYTDAKRVRYCSIGCRRHSVYLRRKGRPKVKKGYTPRVVSREEVESKIRAKIKCLECGITTKGGKDFCSRHILQQPYVKFLLGELADFATETFALENNKHTKAERLIEELCMHLRTNNDLQSFKAVMRATRHSEKVLRGMVRRSPRLSLKTERAGRKTTYIIFDESKA